MISPRTSSIIRSVAVASTLLVCVGSTCRGSAAQDRVAMSLPDAPSAVLQQQNQQSGDISVTVSAPPPSSPDEVRTNRKKKQVRCSVYARNCDPTNRQPILNGRSPLPILTPKDKLILAGRNFGDPFNLALIALSSGITVAADSHSGYGPGFKGWGRSFGTGLGGSSTMEFFGTFAIPSLMHQDPRYHRMPEASVKRRIVHALSRTIIAQSDKGNWMPNYGTLASYPINNALVNLYVPNIQTDSVSTGKRIALGYATDPINNLVSEFLPDIASRIHIRVVFFQEILNKIAIDSSVGR